MQSLHSLRPADHSREDWSSSAPLALSEEGDHAEALQLCESGSQLGLKSFSDVCDGGENRGNSGSISHQDSQHERLDAKCGVEEAELSAPREAKFTKSSKHGRRNAPSRSRTRGDSDAARVGDRLIPTAQLIPAQLMSPAPPAQQYVAHNECAHCDFMTFINQVRNRSHTAMMPASDIDAGAIFCHDAIRATIFRSMQATPKIQLPQDKSFVDLSLSDVWNTLKDASLFGLEIPTCGSVLGRSTAYFVPLLSAMKLFTKTDSVSNAARAGAPPRCRYRGGEGWPHEMDLLASYHAKRLPWERMPLYHDLQSLASQQPSETLPDPQALLRTPLSEMHPCSWIAVWWQPLYRIPDMPLDAKFLAYYTFENLNVPNEFSMIIAGLLSGGVEVHAGDAGATSERWLHLSSGSQNGPVQSKLDEYIRHLHSRAQRLSCNCEHYVEILTKDGTTYEDEMDHKDFVFLQRGRLGPATSLPV